jgi:hypothetical protein
LVLEPLYRAVPIDVTIQQKTEFPRRWALQTAAAGMIQFGSLTGFRVPLFKLMSWQPSTWLSCRDDVKP